jgi:hypothetical protein
MHLPQPNEKKFELVPAGTHLAVCYRVIDLGTQDVIYAGEAKQKHQVLLSWELPDEKMADGRPFTMHSRYTWSMSEKAKLRQQLESWRGTAFTERDFGSQGFNIKNVLGKACLLTVVHAAKDSKTYANISTISKLMKGMTAPPTTVNEIVYLWLTPDLWEPSTFHKLSDGLKQDIMDSPEYKAIADSEDEPGMAVLAVGADEPAPENDIPF